MSASPLVQKLQNVGFEFKKKKCLCILAYFVCPIDICWKNECICDKNAIKWEPNFKRWTNHKPNKKGKLQDSLVGGRGLCQGTEVHTRESGLVNVRVKPPDGNICGRWMHLLYVCKSTVMKNSDENLEPFNYSLLYMKIDC